ncbi:MAG: 16S rRNA (cytidine(1402)-2'-O)-methyltransferase [Acidimicrobiales bacterium]
MSDAEDRRRGRLVLVATPIGNLGDISPRALEVLATAELVCCEDTRRTRALLSAMGIAAGGARGDRLVSLHGHNEGSRVERVLSCVAGGGTVAVVSDAGMPGISDPGALLVSRLADAGETVSVIPGPTSVLSALVVSGLATERFCVEGFLPRRGGERRERIGALMADQRTTIVLEAPGRVAGTLADLAAVDGPRRVAVVRELTKVHEEVWRGTAAEGAAIFADRPLRGEVVLVIAGAPPSGRLSEEALGAAVRRRLDQGPGDGPRQIAHELAETLGVPKRAVYEEVLRLRDEGEVPRGP